MKLERGNINPAWAVAICAILFVCGGLFVFGAVSEALQNGRRLDTSMETSLEEARALVKLSEANLVQAQTIEKYSDEGIAELRAKRRLVDVMTGVLILMAAVMLFLGARVYRMMGEMAAVKARG